MATFAERLKEERKNNNLNQTQLAEKLYLDRSSISKYESGKQIPEIPTLETIADYFEVSLDYLVGRTDIRNYTESGKVASNENEIFNVKYKNENLSLSKKEIEELIEKLEELLEKLNDIIDIKNLL